MLRMSEKRSRILLVFGLIVGIVFFHYGTPRRLMYIHILLQALFFIPVSLAGWWFGKRGGFFAAAAIAIVYTYHAVTVMMPTSEMAVSNGIQIFFLFIVGSLAGTYADIKLSYQEAVSGAKSLPTSILPTNQKLLIYIDETKAAIAAVRYVAYCCGPKSDATVTILGLPSCPSPEFFESSDKHKEEYSRTLESMKVLAKETRSILVESGFAEASIETRLEDSQNTRISDAILEEQKSGGHSTIVIGRHNLSRAEEFLFGNPAIRLARQAPCPVWVIGEGFNDAHTSGGKE